MNKDELLRLNLQYFAEEEGADGGAKETDDKTDDTFEGSDVTDESKEDKPDKNNGGEDKVFTQEELNRIVQERLDRAKQKAADEAERKRLEEQGEYKDLLELERNKVQELEAKEAQRERQDSIREHLVAKGVSGEEDIRKYAEYVDKFADSDDTIEQAVDKVYNDFAAVIQANYADPTPHSGSRPTPTSKTDEDYGRDLFKKLRG